MKYEDQILMDQNGNYLYQGCIAKPYQHFYTRAEWLVVVGEVEAQNHRVWICQNPTIDLKAIALAAIDWYQKAVEHEKNIAQGKVTAVAAPSAKEGQNCDRPKV